MFGSHFSGSVPVHPESLHVGVSLLLGTHRLPPPNPSCLRPECEFAIGLPEMKWRPSRIREVQRGRHVGGVENCDISIGSWDGGWWKWCETPMEWLYPRKMVDFSSRKIDKNMKNGLKWVVRRAFRDLIFSLSMIFWDESYGVAIMGSNLVKKIVLKGSAGHFFFPIFWGVGYKIDAPIYRMRM